MSASTPITSAPSPPISFVSRSSSTALSTTMAANQRERRNQRERTVPVDASVTPCVAPARRHALYHEYKQLRALALSLPSATSPPTTASAAERKSVTNARLLRVHHLLSQLYPSCAPLRPLLRSQRESRERLRLLRAALDDQLVAVSKLDDAANLLLLISEHVALLISCYRSSTSASSSSPSAATRDDATCAAARRLSCLSSARAQDAECDALGVCSTIPRNYKARYLRKCGTLAADALAGAVDLSSFLARQLEARGQHLLIPEIELLSRPCLSIVDLPGGFTLIFRAEVLRKMALDAARMREVALQWRRKQWLFCVKLRRNLAACRRSMQRSMVQLMQLRASLAEQEFVAHVVAAGVSCR